MLRGLWTLTWLELKIFAREPLGLFATIGVPTALFVVLGRFVDDEVGPASSPDAGLVGMDVPVFASLLIVLNAVVSIVAIISIYREGGILKRLHATPLRPLTILGAHVVVKLLLTAGTLGIMVAAGRRFYPVPVELPILSFAAALLFCTASVLSIGFLVASLVPTARFAQPLASILLYPMIGLSGLFFPIEELPATFESIARLLPLTYAVALLKGIWAGGSWAAHLGDVTALVAFWAICTAVSARVFRWE